MPYRGQIFIRPVTLLISGSLSNAANDIIKTITDLSQIWTKLKQILGQTGGMIKVSLNVQYITDKNITDQNYYAKRNIHDTWNVSSGLL